MVDLRTRLYDMRDELVERLAQRIEGGDLALLASVQSAIVAVDAVLLGRSSTCEIGEALAALAEFDISG